MSESARADILTGPVLVALLVFVLVNAALVMMSGVRIGGDSGMYLDGARALASGEPLSVRQPSYAAYIAFIAVIQSIGGGTIGVVVAQVAAALGAAVVVGKMAAHLAGPVAAVMAILLFAIDVETNRWHAFILSDSLFLSLLTLATWLVYRARGLRRGATALAVVVMLLAALVRPEGWFLLPAAVVFWIASATAGATRLIAAAALVVLGGALVFALVPRLSGNLAAVGPAEMLRRGQTIWDFDGWRVEMPSDAVFDDGHASSADAIVYAWRHPPSTVRLMAARVAVHFAHVRPNVKRLRPIALGPFDYENENYVKDLGVAEGFTDYYATVLLRRAGILTDDEYLNGMSNQIEQVQTVPGRLVTPVDMASFDAWIKQYRPDENTANTSVNYYPKGAVIGFLLDAKIRRATSGARSLDTGMQWAMQRYSGEKGYTTRQFYTVMSEAAGTELESWFAKAAESTDELDYSEALDYYGLRFRPVDMKTAAPFIGGGTRNDAGRLIVTSVRRGTPGLDAGLNVDDEIIAIDDVRVRADGLAARLAQYRPGDTVSMLVARRDRLTKIDVTLGADPGRPWRLEAAPNATAEQKARLDALMNGT